MKKLSVSQLSVLALLVSLNVILQGPFLKLDFPGVAQFGFAFVPSALIGVIFGPKIGFIVGAIADVMSFFLFPTPYPFFIGYTLTSALGPMLYGLFLHHKKLSKIRIFTVVLVITVFLNLGLGTLWLSILNGKAYLALLPARISKNIVSLAINTGLLSIILMSPTFQSFSKKYTIG